MCDILLSANLCIILCVNLTVGQQNDFMLHSSLQYVAVDYSVP